MTGTICIGAYAYSVNIHVLSVLYRIALCYNYGIPMYECSGTTKYNRLSILILIILIIIQIVIIIVIVIYSVSSNNGY